MKCSKCDIDMIHLGGEHWHCPACETRMAKLKISGPKFIKQEPYIDDEGIWVPLAPYVQEGCASDYRCLISKEFFVEAYNKWIKESE
jgi:hypothetical protein